MAKAPKGNIDYAALEALILGETKPTAETKPTSTGNAFKDLLAELVNQNKGILDEMKKSQGFIKQLAKEFKKANSSEKSERNPNKKNKEFNKAINQNPLFKELYKYLKRENKGSGVTSSVRESSPVSVDSRTMRELSSLREELGKKGILSADTLYSFRQGVGSINQLLVGSDNLAEGIKNQFAYAAQEVLKLESSYDGFLKYLLKGVGVQANFTKDMRAVLYETAGATKESQKLFRTLEDIENTTKITGFSQEKFQENLLKYAKAGIKYDGNAVKYRSKLLNLTTSQLATEKQLGLEAGELFETFNSLYQTGRLTEAEIADVGRGMRDIARQTGLTGKNLQQALSASQSIIDSMKKASTLTSTSIKNITQTLAQAEKLGVAEQTKTLLDAASSTTNLFFNASQQTKSLLFSAAGSVGKLNELQAGTLTRSRQGIKALGEGVTNVLRTFGVESLEAIDNLSDQAKMKLNLSLKAAFGLEIGELRGVVESLREGGKGFAERAKDLDKKLKENLTTEERLATLEEKRRMQTSQSLEALTILDKAAVGAKNMEEALLKFGDRRKELEKDLQALGLQGTNKEVIRGAIEQAVKNIESVSKKSLGITSTEIQKALEDPVSFRELSSKISKAEASAATKQKTQLDATTETNQILTEIQSSIQSFSGSFLSMFMSNAGPLGIIASSLALASGPALFKGLAGAFKNILGKGSGIAAEEIAPSDGSGRKRKRRTGSPPSAPSSLPPSPAKLTGGFTGYAKDFAVGMGILLATAAVIYGGLMLLDSFGFTIDEKKIISQTKKLGTLFAATLVISTEVLAFGAILTTLGKLNKALNKNMIQGALSAAATFAIMGTALAALGAGLVYLSTIIDGFGIDESKIIGTTKKLSTLFLSVGALSLVVLASAAPMALTGAAIIATKGLLIPALLVGAVTLPILAGVLLSFAMGIEKLNETVSTMDLPVFYKTADNLKDIFSAVGKVSFSIATAGTAALAGLAGGIIGGFAAALDNLLGFLGFDTATSVGRVIEWVGSVTKAANDSIAKLGINPEQLASSAEKLNAIVGPGAKLIGSIALIGAGMLGLSVGGTIGGVASKVAQGIGWGLGKIGILFGGSGKDMSDPANAIQNTIFAFYDILSIIPNVLDIAESKYNVTPAKIADANQRLAKLAEAPKNLGKTLVSLVQQLAELAPHLSKVNAAADMTVNVNPELLANSLQNTFKVITGVLMASSDVTNDMFEATKNIPPKRIHETLEAAKSVTGMIGNFITTSKDLAQNINVKSLDELEKYLGNPRLPAVLQSIFNNMRNTLVVLRNYRISNIELKATSEKMGMIGTLVKGIGSAASGLKEVDEAFKAIKDSNIIQIEENLNKNSKNINAKDNNKQVKVTSNKLTSFFSNLIGTSKGLIEVIKQNKDLNIIEIGKFTQFGENLGKFLSSFKDVLSNFKNNVLAPIDQFSTDDIGKMLQGNMTRTSYYSGFLGWWYKGGYKEEVYKETSDVIFGFKAVFKAVVDINNQVREILKDNNSVKANNVVGLEDELKQNFKTLSSISENFKYLSIFLADFNQKIMPAIMFAIEKKELFDFQKYEGSEDQYNEITNSFWKILVTISTLQSNISAIVKNMDANLKVEDFSKDIKLLENRLKPITSNFNMFIDLIGLLNEDNINKLTNFKSPSQNALENFKTTISDALKNIEGSILQKDFLEQIGKFAISVPRLPDFKIEPFINFSKSISTLLKDFSKAFSFLNEVEQSEDQWTSSFTTVEGKIESTGFIDNAKKIMPTVAEKLAKVKEFFEKDFKPLFSEMGAIIAVLSAQKLETKDFEKAGTILTGFSSVAGSMNDLLTSLGAIGFELTTTSVDTNNIGKTVSTLEFVKSIISNPATSDVAKLMRDIPKFLLTNFIIPFKYSGFQIKPEQMQSIAKILDATVVSINALSGPNGILFNFGKLDPANINKGIEELDKLKEIKFQDQYGSKKTSYLLAEFIVKLIENVIDPLSILNRVTSPKRIENIGKIIAGVKDVAANLPDLIESVGTNSKKLLAVDPTTNLNKVQEVNAKLEEVGEYLPEFVVAVYNNVVIPLAVLPVSKGLIERIAGKIKGITEIANNLPVLIENLSTKFPDMLKGMESIDASLANQFNQKGESFKDVFISILGFITNGIVAPLLISAANPKYLTMAANQITALADLTGDLGPVMIGFFKSMEKLMEYVESKYGADSGNVLSFMADIFDNKFFTGNLIETFDKTIKNLEKLIEIDNLINQLTGFDVNSLSHIFADVDTSTLNLDAMEIAMIDFGDQLDRIIAIMNDNVNRINKINELGEISVNSGKISTAPTAEIPESQAVDMYAKNIQMKESSGSNSESYDELVELNQINESIDSKQSQMIELLGGILRALNVPISVGGKEGESAGAPEKTFNLQEYTSAFSAKLQTGTTSRSAYVKGSNMMVTNSGPFTKRK